MSIELLPESIRENYEVHEWKHSCAILKEDFPEEWADIISVLNKFRFLQKLDNQSRRKEIPNI